MASWAWNWKRGYGFTSPNIVSDENVTKEKGPFGSEIWGPYKKTYTKSWLGQMLFTEPKKVDGVPILCRCRVINQYMRSNAGTLELGAAGAVVVGSKRPACWEDSETIMNPSGGDTFTVTVGHPAFYEYVISKDGGIGILSSFFGGKRKQRKTRKHHIYIKRKTRKISKKLK
jgi:hypothetical protein